MIIVYVLKYVQIQIQTLETVRTYRIKKYTQFTSRFSAIKYIVILYLIFNLPHFTTKSSKYFILMVYIYCSDEMIRCVGQLLQANDLEKWNKTNSKSIFQLLYLFYLWRPRANKLLCWMWDKVKSWSWIISPVRVAKWFVPWIVRREQVIKQLLLVSTNPPHSPWRATICTYMHAET